VSTYVQTAAQRWPEYKIHGSGPHAVIHDRDCWLFETIEQARAVRLGWDDCELLDLRPKFVPVQRNYCWEDSNDRDWERRRRQAGD